jgi:hypothetical protein
MRWITSGIALLATATAGADVLSQAQELGVSAMTLQELAPVQARDGGATLMSVDLGGRVVFVEVEPRSYRADSFKVVLDMGNGVMEEITPPQPKTVRGSVLGEPGSIVTGLIDGGEATLLIFSGGESWTVQPVEGEGAGVHAVYEEGDIAQHEGTCAMPNNAGQNQAATQHHHLADGVNNRGSGDYRIAQIAIDADWHLYNTYFNQNSNSLLNDVDSVIAGLSTIYERDVLLTFELTQVIIRTSSGSNPYTTNNPEGLLTQFQNHWNANHADVVRDVAHLWTGRNMSGSTIGIASLGVICTASAYGADQIRFTGNYNSRVGLFSHEMGHNWNAPHCDGASECRIMCSGLGGCNGLGNPVRFAGGAIGSINAHIATRTCLDNIGVGLPIFENFASSSLDPITWGTVSGFDFVSDGSAPSGNRAGRLTPPFNQLSTVPVDLDVASGNGVAVSLWMKPESSTDKYLKMFAAPIGGSPMPAGRINVPTSSSYVQTTAYLPASLLGTEAQVRFIADSSAPRLRIDDINVYETSGSSSSAPLPFAEDYEGAAIYFGMWRPSDVDVIDVNGAAPSGEYVASMPANGRMETVSLTASGSGEPVFGLLVSSPVGAGPGDELVLQYRNSSGTWIEAGRFAASAFPSDGFALAEVILPAAAAHNSLRVAVETTGTGGSTPWRFDDVEVGGDVRGAADCPADIAPPAGVLDLGDINAFIAGFTGQQPIADLAAPFGVFDLADIGAFIAGFTAGCP